MADVYVDIGRQFKKVLTKERSPYRMFISSADRDPEENTALAKAIQNKTHTG